MTNPSKNTTTSRRAFLAGVPIAAVALTPAGAALGGPETGGTAISEPDPIFAVIERHRAELDAFFANLEASNLVDEESEEWERLQNAANPCDFLLPVLTVRPTTLAGLSALLSHVALPEFPDQHPDEPPILFEALNEDSEAAKAFLPNIAATLRDLITASGKGGAS
jgi:hypothetical protein